MMHEMVDAISSYDYLTGCVAWIIKSACLLALALTTCRFLRRSSPAVRNMILRSSIFGVLLLAFAIPLTPVWQIPSSEILPINLPQLNAPLQAAGSSNTGIALWWLTAIAIWMIGAAFFATRLLAGMVITARLIGSAEDVRDARILSIAHGIESELGIREPVRYLTSPRVSLPLTWGILSPVVIVPKHNPAGNHEAMMVLRHELAHVRRRDVLWLNLATLLTIIQWFNPLVWIARRRLQIESESACDNYVLTGEISPDTYARHVLESARTAATAGRLVITCMAFNSHLEGRIMAILNSHKREFVTKRSTNMAVIVALLVGCLTFAGLTLDSCNTTDQSDSASALSGTQQTAPPPNIFIPVDTTPEMTYLENPAYPKSAKEAGIEGEVWVKAFVNDDGTVTDAVVAKSSGHEDLDDAAVSAAAKNTFTPAVQDGKPVGVWVTYKVMFELSDKKDSEK